MIPFLVPSLDVFRIPLPRFGLPGANVVDILMALVIGGIDTNPLLDLVLTPIAWAITFLT